MKNKIIWKRFEASSRQTSEETGSVLFAR